ncbi:PPE domain-containing protein [Rhodococcus hoagii]|nr:PPE domain-containing protein [Prescottella equi]
MAAMVTEAIAALGVQVGSITGQWQGFASAQMSATTAPFAAWLAEMSATATLNAQRSAGVVQAYASGMASMVPLPVVIANRTAARIAQVAGALGAVNTEMVRLEIEYAGFWTHNASVMTGYDAAVTTATTPTPVAPPPPLVVDAVPGVSGQTQLQQLGQQLADQFAAGRGAPAGFMSRYAGPSLANSSTLARLLGSGAGTSRAFGGRGASLSGGGGAGGGVRGAGLSGGLNGLLTPPLATFTPPNGGAGVGQSGPAFGGVQNTASTARPATPMTPPMGRGSKMQQDLEQREREMVTAANQEFVVAPAQSATDNLQSGEEISVRAHLR